ncbi:MAG: hypothetical protein CM15mP112_02740 [Flavobacteriales bacterium]|nr:MAG: hypothetical protein CM15mP112_02740 [Flavobacteriales bacterium]
MAFTGGLSFNLGDVIVPDEKEHLINEANKKVDEITSNYSMGFITIMKDTIKLLMFGQILMQD